MLSERVCIQSKRFAANVIGYTSIWIENPRCGLNVEKLKLNFAKESGYLS
jgi:hypothetical protein